MRRCACGRPWSDGYPTCLSEFRRRCPYCVEAYSLAIPIHLEWVKNWNRWFDLSHLKERVVGVDQPQVDLSPSDSVTIIVPLCLMALDALPHQLDVRTPMPFDCIITQLVSCQGGPPVLLLWGGSPFDGT